MLCIFKFVFNVPDFLDHGLIVLVSGLTGKSYEVLGIGISGSQLFFVNRVLSVYRRVCPLRIILRNPGDPGDLRYFE